MACVDWLRGRCSLLLLCAGVLAVLAERAQAHATHKRQDMSPAPFTFAARYGRSPDRLIAPRNNRWMLTARYGKRSQPFTMDDSSTSEAPPPLREGTLAAREGPRGVRGVPRALACVYTGVLALYRCTHTLTLAARRSDVLLPSEE